MADRTVMIIIDVADKTQGRLDGLKKSLLAIDAAAQKTRAKLASLGNRTYNATLRLIDRVTQPGSRINAFLKSIASKTYTITAKMGDAIFGKIRSLEASLMRVAGRAYTVAVNLKDNVSGKIKGLTDGLLMGAGGLGVGMLGTAGIGYGAVNALQSYMSFEKQMSRVQALRQLDKNSPEMQALVQQAKDLGMQTAWTREQVGQAMEYMALAGFETPQMLKATPHLLNLASAGGIDLGSASDMMTDAMTAFNLKATDSFKNAAGQIIDMPQYFSDMLAKVQASSNTDLLQLREAIKYGAPTIGTMFAGVEGQEGVQLRTEAARQMLVMLGLEANAGIKGSMAGTGVNTLFNRLAGENRNTHFAERLLGLEHAENGNMLMPLDFIKAFQRKIKNGMDVDEFMQISEELAGEKIHADTRRKLNSTIESALKNGGKLGSADVMKMASMLAGLENMPKLLAMVFQDIDALESKMTNVEGTASGMADTMLDNLAGEFTRLGSAWDAFQQGFFEGGAGDGIRDFVKSLTELTTRATKLFADGIQFADVGKMVVDVIDRLKNKFMELDGIGSLLAGGALMAAFVKIGRMIQRVIGYAGQLKGLQIGQMLGGATGAGAKGGTISSASQVGTMNVTAGVVNIAGKAGAGGVGGTGGRKVGDQSIISRYQQEKERIRGTGAPPPPSMSSTFRSGAMSGAAFAAIFGAMDVLNSKSISEERAKEAADALKVARSEYDELVRQGRPAEELAQHAADIQRLQGEQNQILQENQARERETLAGATGSVLGAAIGAGLGSLVGPMGTMIGGMIGSMIGEQGGKALGSIEPVRDNVVAPKSTVSESLIESKTAERLGIKKEEPTGAFSEVVKMGWLEKAPLSYMLDKREGQNFFGYNGTDILGAYDRRRAIGNAKPRQIERAGTIYEDELAAFAAETKALEETAQRRNFERGLGAWSNLPQQTFDASQMGKSALETYKSQTARFRGERQERMQAATSPVTEQLFAPSMQAAAMFNPYQMQMGEVATPDLSAFAEIQSQVESFVSSIGESISGLGSTISDGLTSAFDGASEVVSSFATSIGEGLTSAVTSAGEMISSLGSTITEGLTTALTGAGEMFTSFGELVNSALTSAQGVAASALSAISSTFETARSAIMSAWGELPGFFSGVFSGLGGAAAAAGSAIYSGLTSVIGAVIGAWQSAASVVSSIISSISAMASSAASMIPSFGGGGGGAAYAEGGFVDSPTQALIGEAGAEVVIPLSTSKRSRALDLFEKTAAILGQGAGIPNSDFVSNIPELPANDNFTLPADTPVTTSASTSPSNNKAEISLGSVNVSFEISGVSDSDKVVAAIKERLSEVTNQIAIKLSEQVGDAFGNMAVKH